MLDFLKDSEIEENKKEETTFYEQYEVLLFPYESLLLSRLSIEQYLSFLSEIKSIKTKYSLFYIRRQIYNNLFSRRFIPDKTAFEYIEKFYPELSFFYETQYRFLRFTDIFCFVLPKNNPKISLIELKEQIEALNSRFNLHFFDFKNNETYRLYVKFFCLIFKIYNSAIDRQRIENLETRIKDSVTKAKNIKFDIEDNYTALEFCSKIEEIENNFSLSELSYFTFGANSDFKILREEYHFIAQYLRKIVKNDAALVKLGKKTEQWDAKINDEIVEITLAVYDKEFLIRHLFSEGYSLPLSYQTIDQIGKDEILDVILKAIHKKMKKDYCDKRTLLVVTEREFFEYFDICDNYFGLNTFHDAIAFLREKLVSQTEFSKIYLFLDEQPIPLFS